MGEGNPQRDVTESVGPLLPGLPRVRPEAPRQRPTHVIRHPTHRPRNPRPTYRHARRHQPPNHKRTSGDRPRTAIPYVAEPVHGEVGRVPPAGPIVNFGPGRRSAADGVRLVGARMTDEDIGDLRQPTSGVTPLDVHPLLNSLKPR
jgi:hypothetical protein